ncbi:O-methyltransferase [Flavobacteriaceae bacterium]|jgi:predicted O-methyltransferase YrrM|uniref:O-methyltransferase n=1 Tax=Candidatus Arcticimaribacter forsetii TaxID=2820661 RepID=UPI00207797EB|nr:O-methyltransferase [Candidatus Arcticimaribacter forsetii]MDA8698762.1 O-methyltransferase [Flavobacteriaceae bacterium]MDB2325729.1 O-methyltransferase [Flavobacteriaceae bacterium]MDB4620739.1 O-methyltransferase [Flavobacteriaceae bacterium]MDB4674699.1 O-methyltransferase [Flavobacteriaceae bacterium]MDB4738628.1 O-methyltransferase [Flavobacteriaceae bacterium]
MDFISSGLLDYVTKHSNEEPQILKDLTRETYQKVLLPRMLSGPLQGRFLSVLSKIIRPKKILEIGTYTGYATLCLAEGLAPNGIIDTLDKNEELLDFQRKYFNRSGYGDQINQHLGNAIDIIPKLSSDYDLVFLDADKTNYINYFELIIPKMNSGGVILSDNVLWSGKVIKEADVKDKDTQVLQEFNKLLATDKRVESVLLPLRDGLTISRVI